MKSEQISFLGNDVLSNIQVTVITGNNNFHVMPGRMRKSMPGVYIKLSELIGKSVPWLFGFMAVNYIAKYEYVGGKR